MRQGQRVEAKYRIRCKGCGKHFMGTRPGQKFHPNNKCRPAWHYRQLRVALKALRASRRKLLQTA